MENRDIIEKVQSLKNILVAWAEGDRESCSEYADLRLSLISDPILAPLLPECVRICRTRAEFWGFIKPKFQHYQERREYLRQQFDPILNYLEGQGGPLSTPGLPKDEGRKMAGRTATRVFVVYGRNYAAYDAMVLFLQSLGLDPRDFREVRNEIGGSPFIGEIVKYGMDRAQAYVVLLTPDERASLHPTLRKEDETDDESERWQPRPNVLLEAGMALAIDPGRTLLVVLGKMALPSDLDGRHVIRLNNDVDARKGFKEALAGIGCPIRETGHWHRPIAGDFEACLQAPLLPEIKAESPFVERGVSNEGHGKGSCHIRLGNIFDGPCDMVVLPCSAKGTISKASRAWVDQFGIPMPLQMRAGDIQVIPFTGSGAITRLTAWAASVLNDHSTSETIEAIGRKLGEYTVEHPDVHLIWCPLLGAGAGGLSPEVSASSLKRGFKTAAAEDATLVITALQTDLVERARRACR